ncbi:diaminopropionate ammonia-lyase (plasmid) [Entomospira entomophila]|uniref:Diaminopropionate ammonia-lyase n=2 Tax=Entomospira entomophila TaxID=2719988 RepID=A0A968GAZ0_9SPIO|nr:diaminopropionate ammonia-lyase [Entomospira entomophilus]NIZ41331.1 diaminopropionate ammonia-lyase [Entomospira entomophilus]WDI36272.1 diaminopropionate ammonia-lyase [Entomospira entomophilus]
MRGHQGGDKFNIDFLNVETAKSVHAFHQSFSVYQETPLVNLEHLAKKIDVAAIYVKDESYRFGLNAFKVLGGSYSIGKVIAQKLEEDISQLPATRMVSKEIKDKLGAMTFVTATDGNHGRGVAWTANQLGQKSIVYMPKGSAIERLENIQAEGAEASITELNYDDAVRLANERAEKEGGVMVQDTAWEGYEEIPTWIMQGYMTLGYEAVQQLLQYHPDAPTHVFIQAGVGSLAGGITGFLANYYGKNKPKIIVVEPDNVDCIFKTAEANDGKLHYVTGDLTTIMAGLACGEPNMIGWNVLKDYADGYLTCTEEAAADGMRILGAPLTGDQRIISGESGAAPFGAFMTIMLHEQYAQFKQEMSIDQHSRILFISTEGDTDQENYENIIWFGKYNSK